MRRFSNTKAMLRAVAIVGSVMVLAGGVTFAALQSQQSIIKGNTIQTAVASLKLSTDDVTYASSINGFVFSDLIPGGSAMPANGFPIYLKNTGTVGLNLKLSLSKAPTNPNNVDLAKVHVLLKPSDGSGVQTFTLAALIAGDTAGGVALAPASHMYAGQMQAYTLSVQMDQDALSGPTASLSDIDLSFGAVAG